MGEWRIHQLEIVYQRQATPEEIEEDAGKPKDMRRVSGWREGKMKLISYREFVPCDIPMGEGGGSTQVARRLVTRVLASTVEDYYQYFYAIAHMVNKDGDETARTLVPRTEITLQIRRLRH